MKYEIDEKGFLTGNWASVGGFENCIEIDKLEEIDLNLRWNGASLVLDTNPKVIAKELKNLRNKRENECFSVINRGQLWYNKLTEEQRLELDIWYKKWLDVTETRIIPEKPIWLN